MEGRPLNVPSIGVSGSTLAAEGGSPRAVFGQEFSFTRRAIFRAFVFAILLVGIPAFLSIVNSANAQVRSERPARALITQGINERATRDASWKHSSRS